FRRNVLSKTKPGASFWFCWFPFSPQCFAAPFSRCSMIPAKRPHSARGVAQASQPGALARGMGTRRYAVGVRFLSKTKPGVSFWFRWFPFSPECFAAPFSRCSMIPAKRPFQNEAEGFVLVPLVSFFPGMLRSYAGGPLIF
ncbi:MAG: hypothetical protein IKN89_12115, partial [Oscillospiraceae bacterium]|nr:hypothetical protein [Oscillospiraceae bacterium]